MKSPSKLAGFSLAGLSVLVVAIIITQQQVVSRLRQQNSSLQQQLDRLAAEASKLAEERQQLLSAPQQANAAAPLPKEQFSELLRLRGDAGRMRIHEREMEQARREEMQAARAKLAEAETHFARLTNLYAARLVGVGERDQALFAIELLK